MSTKRVPKDPFLRDVASDVVVRFREHDQYGSWEKAVKAFKRRVPGYDDAIYEFVLRFFCDLLDQTIPIVGQTRLPLAFQLSHKESKQEYEAAVSLMKQRYPTVRDRVLLSTFINWVNFWHYLK